VTAGRYTVASRCTVVATPGPPGTSITTFSAVTGGGWEAILTVSATAAPAITAAMISMAARRQGVLGSWRIAAIRGTPPTVGHGAPVLQRSEGDSALQPGPDPGVVLARAMRDTSPYVEGSIPSRRRRQHGLPAGLWAPGAVGRLAGGRDLRCSTLAVCPEVR
jgi:hypothetical protein